MQPAAVSLRYSAFDKARKNQEPPFLLHLVPDNNKKLLPRSQDEFLSSVIRTMCYLAEEGSATKTAVAEHVLGKRQKTAAAARILNYLVECDFLELRSNQRRKKGGNSGATYTIRWENRGVHRGLPPWVTREGADWLNAAFARIKREAREFPRENWRQVAALRPIDEEWFRESQTGGLAMAHGMEITLSHDLLRGQYDDLYDDLLGHPSDTVSMLMEAILQREGLAPPTTSYDVARLVRDLPNIAPEHPAVAYLWWMVQGGPYARLIRTRRKRREVARKSGTPPVTSS